MKSKTFIFPPIALAVMILVTLACSTSNNDEVTTSSDSNKSMSDLSEIAMSFVPNKGQTDPAVHFHAQEGNSTLFFTSNEVIFMLPDPLPIKEKRDQGDSSDSTTTVFYTSLHLQFDGAYHESTVKGAKLLPGTTNYLIGNDPHKWLTNIPTYGEIVYEHLYPGIDLYYGGSSQKLKGTYVVAPHADPGSIRWRYEGATNVQMDKTTGNLIITFPASTDGVNMTEAANHVLIEESPIAWQTIDNHRISVKARFHIQENGDIGFILGKYNSSYILTIDPILIYSRYLGGDANDYGTDIAVDSTGNSYVTGWTNSTNFPMANARQENLQGSNDAFVTKLNTNGNIVYSTYLGGSGSDGGTGIAVDSLGNAYITGFARSDDFPLALPLQSSFHGVTDGFVTKLSPDGSTLIYSTFIGGSAFDEGRDIAVDNTDQVYVIGDTESSDFPTLSPLQSSNTGNQDAFILKLNANGNALIFSTYLGGFNDENGRGIATDLEGNTYAVGGTDSANFPTANAIQPGQGGYVCGTPPNIYPCTDAFITKLNSTGSAFIYSTYLGGSNGETGYGIATNNNSTYITGRTTSSNFPTVNPIQTSGAGFVSELNEGGGTLLYSTYLDSGGDIAVDNSGNAYILGSAYTLTTSFDVAVYKINPGGNTLIYQTKIGGSSGENEDNLSPGVGGIALDNMGNVYFTGGTSSTDFPVTCSYFVFTGLRDAFVTKISDEIGATPAPCNTLVYLPLVVK
jgi:hypothetical protein